MNTPLATVDAYDGYKGEKTPHAFTIDGLRLFVDEILAHWDTERHGCFRVLASDGLRYVLRYDFGEEQWELVMQERPEHT